MFDFIAQLICFSFMFELSNLVARYFRLVLKSRPRLLPKKSFKEWTRSKDEPLGAQPVKYFNTTKVLGTQSNTLGVPGYWAPLGNSLGKLKPHSD